MSRLDSSLLLVVRFRTPDLYEICALTYLAVLAVSGLSVALAPDVTHYLRFLQPLMSTNELAAGVATYLAPALAATLFIVLAYFLLYRKGPSLCAPFPLDHRFSRCKPNQQFRVRIGISVGHVQDCVLGLHSCFRRVAFRNRGCCLLHAVTGHEQWRNQRIRQRCHLRQRVCPGTCIDCRDRVSWIASAPAYPTLEGRESGESSRHTPPTFPRWVHIRP